MQSSTVNAPAPDYFENPQLLPNYFLPEAYHGVPARFAFTGHPRFMSSPQPSIYPEYRYPAWLYEPRDYQLPPMFRQQFFPDFPNGGTARVMPFYGDIALMRPFIRLPHVPLEIWQERLQDLDEQFQRRLRRKMRNKQPNLHQLAQQRFEFEALRDRVLGFIRQAYSMNSTYFDYFASVEFVNHEIRNYMQRWKEISKNISETCDDSSTSSGILPDAFVGTVDENANQELFQSGQEEKKIGQTETMVDPKMNFMNELESGTNN